MDNKRMIIGGVILVIIAVFAWYVYTNYISTKKNYEKIYDKYYNKKFMMDNKNSAMNSIVSRKMIADLLPATKYKLKFCDNKDVFSDSTIYTLFRAFIIVCDNSRLVYGKTTKSLSLHPIGLPMSRMWSCLQIELSSHRPSEAGPSTGLILFFYIDSS